MTGLTSQEALNVFNQGQSALRGIAKQDITQTGEITEILVTEDADEGYKAELKRVLFGLPPEGFERLCQRVLRESVLNKLS